MTYICSPYKKIPVKFAVAVLKGSCTYYTGFIFHILKGRWEQTEIPLQQANQCTKFSRKHACGSQISFFICTGNNSMLQLPYNFSWFRWRDRSTEKYRQNHQHTCMNLDICLLPFECLHSNFQEKKNKCMQTDLIILTQVHVNSILRQNISFSLGIWETLAFPLCIHDFSHTTSPKHL